MRLYCGNIPFAATAQTLCDMFAEYGTVTDSNVVLDRDTQRPRGFGFVEIDDAGGRKAIEQLNGTNMGGRSIVVNEAKERSGGSREPRPDRDRKRDGRDRSW